MKTLIMQDGLQPSLKEMQEFVGGNIELVHVRINLMMIVNEDGISEELQENEYASIIADQRIVGNAMVLLGKAVLT